MSSEQLDLLDKLVTLKAEIAVKNMTIKGLTSFRDHSDIEREIKEIHEKLLK